PAFFTDPWIVGGFALAAAVLVFLFHRREGRTASPVYKLLLTGLRVGVLLLAVVVLLPLLPVRIERQGWPDLILILHQSYSMSTVDNHLDAEVQQAADALAQAAQLTSRERLSLAQSLLTRPDADWLTALITKRKVKVHVYHCSSKTARLTDVSDAAEVGPALQ